jgi:hypothetical protein
MLLFGPNTFVFSTSKLKIKMYETIILPVVLYEYGCEVWSLT